MSNINMPKEKAIKLLNDRLSDITGFNFEFSSWKSRTSTELRDIFGMSGRQHIEISSLIFSGNGDKTTRDRGIRLLKSYIDYIIDNVSDTPPQVEPVKNFFTEYKQAMTTLEQSQKNFYTLKAISESNEVKLEKAEKRITELEESEFQTENLTIIKFFRLFGNLPFPTLFAVLGFLIAVFVFVFWAGVWAHTHGLASL